MAAAFVELVRHGSHQQRSASDRTATASTLPSAPITTLGSDSTTYGLFAQQGALYYDLARSFDLDPAAKPFKLDIAETVRGLGYKATYSLGSLLRDLASYGDAGPPRTH